MSDDRAPARIPKWPFYLADLILSAVAVYALYWLGGFQGSWDVAVVAAALVAAAIAAWISIIPWMAEYRAQVKLAEREHLASSLEQVQRIDQVAEQIKLANSQWQNVQDASHRTVKAAAEISEKMRVEAEEFMKFIQNAHDQERAHLRLELDKMKRAEGDWLKVIVQMMDHIHALAQAGERSGQQALITQLNQFQSACRDAARRIGLVPFIPTVGEGYDQRAHQLPDAKFQAPDDSKVGQVLAAGYTFQGQLLRRSLVLLANPETPSAPEAAPAQESQAPVEEYFAPEPAESEQQPEAQPFEPERSDELPPEDEPQAQIEPDPEPEIYPQAASEQEPETENDQAAFPEQEPEPAASATARDYSQEEEAFEEIETVDWEPDARERSSKANGFPQEADSQSLANHDSADDQAEEEQSPPQTQPEKSAQYPRQLPLV